MIHVCYGMSDEDGHFTKYPAVSICSLLENTSEKISIHFIHDSTLTPANKDKLIELVAKYEQKIFFYNVDELYPDRMKNLQQKYDSIAKVGKWSVGAMYRLLAPEILPPEISKVIYFDTDIVLNLDVKELWNLDMKTYPIAAKVEADIFPNEPPYNKKLTEEQIKQIDFTFRFPKKLCTELNLVRYENYFASDVMILNLKQIREIFEEENSTLIDTSFDILTRYDMQFIDQDALNYLFSETCYHLPAKYNVFVLQDGTYMNLTGIPGKIQRWIYHYSGYNQGFQKGNPFFELWFRYFLKTGFLDTEMIFNIAEDYCRQLDDERMRMQSILKTIDRKKITAIAFKETFPALKNLGFENIIDVENLGELSKDFFYMIFINGYELLRERFLSQGFVEDLDFCNGMKILTRSQGGLFREDRYIIRDM